MTVDQFTRRQIRITVTTHGIQGMYLTTAVTKHHHALTQQVAPEGLVLNL